MEFAQWIAQASESNLYSLFKRNIFTVMSDQIGEGHNVLSRKQSEEFYSFIYKELFTYKDDLAKYIKQNLNNDPHFEWLASKIKNDYKMYLRSDTLTHKTVAVLVGLREGGIGLWSRGDRGATLRSLRDIYNHFNAYYKSCSILKPLYKTIMKKLKSFGVRIIPTTKSSLFIERLLELIGEYETRIIDDLLGYPNNELSGSQLEKVLNKRLLNHPIHKYVEWNSERSRYVFSIIDHKFLNAFLGEEFSEDAIKNWRFEKREISSKSYDRLYEALRNLFGTTLESQFIDFKGVFHSLGSIPSIEAKKIVEEAFMEYFSSNKKVYQGIASDQTGKVAQEIQDRLSYSSVKHVRKLIIDTIGELLQDKDRSFFAKLLKNKRLMKRVNKWFVDDINSLIEKIDDCKDDEDIIGLSELLYTLVFTNHMSLQDVRNFAKGSEKEVLTSLGEWIQILLDSDGMGSHLENVLVKCKKCGYIQRQPVGSLRFKSESCIACKGTGVKRRNERVTGAMIESFLMQIEEYKKENPNANLEIVDVNKEIFVSKGDLNDEGEPLNPDRGIFTIAEEDIPNDMGLDYMRFDYSITLRINGEYYTFVFESDGGQHMDNGKGFLDYLGVSRFPTSQIRTKMKYIEGKGSVEDVGKLMKTPEFLSDRQLWDRFKDWSALLYRDNYKDERFKEQPGDGSEKNPYKFLVRIPTWDPNEGGLEDSARPGYIIDTIREDSGIDLVQFGVKLDHLQDFSWDEYIAFIESKYGLWKTDEQIDND